MDKIKTPSGFFYLEKDSLNQWLVRYSDGTWSIASKEEIVMWNLLKSLEIIEITGGL